MRETDWLKDTVRLCNADDLSERSAEFEVLRKQYHGFSEKERNTIRNVIKKVFGINDRIYIYSIVMNYMPHAEFAEDMMDAFIENNFNPYVGSMLEYQTYRIYDYVKYLYKKRRIFHKKNVQGFDDFLSIDYPYIKPADRNKKKIVFVAEHMLSYYHAPSKMAVDFMLALKKIGYEIFVFLCPNDNGLPDGLWHGVQGSNTSEALKNGMWKIKYQGSFFEGYQINMDESGIKEYRMMLSIIYAWNPMFVFALGVSNPVIDLAGKFTTLVAGEVSTACPVSEGKILLRLDRGEEELEQEYAKVLKEENQTQIFMEEKMPVVIQNSTSDYTRADAGLPEDRFLAAIVGNRLDQELKDDFVEVMYSMLEKIPNLDFVIIGEVSKAREKLADCRYENRIHFLGFREDLMQVYRILDLYINPERHGGGFSSAMALNAGIPVVTLPDCDVAYNAGEEFIVKDYGSMTEAVEKYANDKEFYNQKTAAANRNAEKNTDQKLMEYMETLVDHVVRLIYEEEEKNDCI